jgi:hypothetical protein
MKLSYFQQRKLWFVKTILLLPAQGLTLSVCQCFFFLSVRKLQFCSILRPREVTLGKQIYILCCVYVYLLHLAQPSFLPKNQMLQNGFLISVTLRWHSGVKNHEIWTFKVNFLCQKMSESFYFFFIEEYQFRTTFFVKYIFW